MMLKMNQNFNFFINEYLSVRYSSYSFLIHNCLSHNFEDICLNFFENYFSDCSFINDNCLFVNKNSKFSRESIDEINEFRKKTNFHDNEIYKFIIISDVNSLDLLYLNMLLKIIEESDNKLVFFLFASSGFNILKSLKSRCFLLDYNILQDKTGNENYKIDHCDLEEIISLIQTKNNEIETVNLVHKYHIYYLYSTVERVRKNSKESGYNILNDIDKLELFLRNLNSIEQNFLNNKFYFSDYKSFVLDFLY